MDTNFALLGAILLITHYKQGNIDLLGYRQITQRLGGKIITLHASYVYFNLFTES